MRIIKVIENDQSPPDTKPGWYVIDDDGKIIAGPFDTMEEAQQWIDNNRPPFRI